MLTPPVDPKLPAARTRMPVVYLPHGGGPWPFVDMGLDRRELAALTDYLRGLSLVAPVAPRALLVVSAHWENDVATVTSAVEPPLLFDYYGFPAQAYQVTWPAPGSPDLAQRVQTLLDQAAIPSANDPERGFDHGTFVPLKVAYPQPTLPTVQLSLKRGLDPAEHWRIGEAIAPLRDEGVLIIGSGMSFHNLHLLRQGQAASASQIFDTWLKHVVLGQPGERQAGLMAWERAPAARLAHPREEHLLPLMVIAGAAGNDPATLAFSDKVMSAEVSAFHFGAA